MPLYEAPLDDMRFTLQHLVGGGDLMACPGFDALDETLVDSILSESAKVCQDSLSSVNYSGHLEHSKHIGNGQVQTPKGFKEAHDALAEGGWIGLAADPDFGGQGLPRTLSTAVSEMWQAANMSLALCPLLSQGVIDALEAVGSDTQKARYLPALIEGRWTGTMNLTEPQAGTDLASLRTQAVREGDHYRIKGQKIFITYGEHDMSENIIHLVLARTPDAPAGTKGISLFIVPKFILNEDGEPGERNDVTCISIEDKLGILGSPTCVLQYGEKDGAVGYLVGEENMGLSYMFIMMNRARFEVGVQGLGISQMAYQHALAYARERMQGQPLGRSASTPIIGHPDVKRLLAEMKAQIEAMRALAYVAASELDKTHMASDDAGRAAAQTRLELLVPIVKAWSTELSIEITSNGVQVHGGTGFIEETGAAQYYRDARILPIYEGTTAIQANDMVFRKTLRDQGTAVKALLGEMASDLQGPLADQEPDQIAAFKASLADTQKALDAILSYANEPANAAAVGVPYLKMMGYVCGAWLMLRAAKAAQIELASASPTLSSEFLTAKIKSAAFYMSHILPRARALATTVCTGASHVLAIEDDWL